MESITDIALGVAGAAVAIALLCIVKMVGQLASEAFHALVRGMQEARWGVIAFHSGLGFVVSLLVSPRLSTSLTVTAALTSTFLAGVLMKKLQSFEVKPRPRSGARS